MKSAKVEVLRAAIKAGEASGIAEGAVLAEVRERIRHRASQQDAPRVLLPTRESESVPRLHAISKELP